MAIAIVQSKHVTQSSVFTSSFQNSAVDSNPTQNNLMVFWATFGGDSGTVTPPTGWTAVATDALISGNSSKVLCHYKLAGASEGKQWTWTTTDEVQNAYWSFIELSGVDTSQPIDVAGTYGTEGFANSEYSVAAITIATNLAWDFAALQTSSGGGTGFTSSAAGYTEWADTTAAGIYYKEVGLGTTGTRGITNPNLADRRGFSFAVRPSGGGGGGGGNPWYYYANQRRKTWVQLGNIWTPSYAAA